MYDLDAHPDWDYVDVTDSRFGPPMIDGSTVRVPVRELVVGAGFPGYEYAQLHSQCTLVFTGVVKSVRHIGEYADRSQRTFKPSYTVDDGPFPESRARVFRFHVGDWSYKPRASISWEIIAERVHIEDETKSRIAYESNNLYRRLQRVARRLMAKKGVESNGILS